MYPGSFAHVQPIDSSSSQEESRKKANAILESSFLHRRSRMGIRADTKHSQQQIRIAARRRVYGVPLDGKGKELLRLPSPPSSGSEEEITQIHLDMFALLSAGIHPHLLLHHHLIHPSTDSFSGDTLDNCVPDGPNQHPPPKQLNSEDISPHRIVKSLRETGHPLIKRLDKPIY
ncbi:hypothetical protein F5887DRAFT_1080955 [Amanita rubescens]|nr:hypothetical protein F5887DRAFT_1080955 [Amanita rubescens]